MIRAVIFRKEARPTELRETNRKVERVFLSKYKGFSNLGLGILIRQKRGQSAESMVWRSEELHG